MSLDLGIKIRDTAVLSWVRNMGDQGLSLNHDLDDKSLVIDFGGYSGDWSKKIYTKYQCNIEIYEPFSEFVEQIKEKFSGIEKVKIHNFAAGGDNYVANLIEDDLATRIVENKSGNIHVIDAASVIEKRNIDLLKINIEGSEYEVFESIFRNGIVKNVKNYLVQFHPIDNNSISKYEFIANELSKTHDCVFRYPFIWEKWSLKRDIL